ncbi:MAG: DNA starvation/stationary phase protection protein Dps [Phycisphaerae bacterium]|nr:DNA starvation/stationary phase protection protein Dps [Phycisphaerae bacterium]
MAGNSKHVKFATKNDIPESNREKLVELLNARLADLLDLQTQAKQAHWNVKGPNFIALHELFDEVSDGLRGYVDDVAERAVQLGGVAMGTARLAAKSSTLSEYPADIADGAAHVRALSDAMALCGKHVRAAIDASDEFGDKDTADLFTEISRGLDKHLWFVEAHLQSGK